MLLLVRAAPEIQRRVIRRPRMQKWQLRLVRTDGRRDVVTSQERGSWRRVREVLQFGRKNDRSLHDVFAYARVGTRSRKLLKLRFSESPCGPLRCIRFINAKERLTDAHPWNLVRQLAAVYRRKAVEVLKSHNDPDALRTSSREKARKDAEVACLLEFIKEQPRAPGEAVLLG